MRGKLALVVAIVLGLIAVLGFRQMLRNQTEAVGTQLNEEEIVAASETIKQGTPVTLRMMTPIKWPEKAITSDNIMWEEERLVYLNQTLAHGVERGGPILKSYFAQAAVEVGTRLRPGHVAAAFRVDDVSGVAGMIRPGDHIDVLGTLPLPARQGGAGGDVTTERLLADCVVVAVDNRTALTDMGAGAYGRGGQTYSTISLDLTPTEAVILTYAQAQGKITFTLRNPTDSAGAGPAGLKPRSLAEPAAEPPEITLTNVRGEAARAKDQRKTDLSASQ